MASKTKISPWQLLVLLLLGRIMYSMLYQAKNFTSGTPMMLGQLFATIIEAVLSVPLLIFLTKEAPLAESITKNKAVASVIKGLFAVYFVTVFAQMLSAFAKFMHTEFSVIGSPVTVIIILAVASAYCASLGLRALARSAGIVFWCVIILIISMALLSEGKPDLIYLQPMVAEDVKTMLDYMNESRGSSWWLPLTASLAGSLKKDSWKAGIGYLIGKLVFLEALIFAVTLTLWRFVNIPGYPILALGAYARTDFIQRFDAVNMFVWTLNCVTVGASYLYSSAGGIGRGAKVCIWLFAGASASLAVIRYFKLIPIYDSVDVAFRGWGTLILGVVLPTVALIAIKIRRRKCG